MMPFLVTLVREKNQAKSLKFTSTNIILKMSHEVSPFSGLTLDKSGLAAYWLFSFTTCYYLILKPGPIPCDSQLCRYHESFSIGVSPHLSKPSGLFTPLPFVPACLGTWWGSGGTAFPAEYLQEVFLKQGCEATRQWAFVTFASAEEAVSAQEQTHGVLTFEGSIRPCQAGRGVIDGWKRSR